MIPKESHSALAPAAIRQASRLFAGQTQQLDFDVGSTLFPDPGTRGASSISAIWRGST